jgi:hypothetical protein
MCCRGQHHGRPHDELNLVIPIDEGAELRAYRAAKDGAGPCRIRAASIILWSGRRLNRFFCVPGGSILYHFAVPF